MKRLIAQVRAHSSSANQNPSGRLCDVGSKNGYLGSGKSMVADTDVYCASKKAKKGGGKGSVAPVWSVKQFGCVFQDADPPQVRSILRKGTSSLRPKRRVQFAPEASESAEIRQRKPSLAVIQPISFNESRFHVHSFHAPKFGERTQADTLAKERWARREALTLVNMLQKSKETCIKTEQHSSHLRKCGVFLRHPPSNQRQESLSWIPGHPCTC